MAYIINKTDGTPIVTVPDGQIDQATTDIVLVGKNYSGFGEFLNENFVKILENFANESQPNNPLAGQLWYDTRENRIKVYSGSTWNAIGTAVLAEERPLGVGVGDFWFSTINKQLYFYDGVRDYLIGPDFKASQGLSGIVIETIEDSSRRQRTVAALYVSNVLSGYFSNSEFTCRNRPAGYNADPGIATPSIRSGFNPANPNDFKFRGTTVNSEQLGGRDSSLYAVRTIANTFLDQITIQVSESALSFGTANQGRFSTSAFGDVIFSNTADLRRLELRVTKNGVNTTALQIFPKGEVDGNIDEFNIFPNNAGSVVNVGGALVVSGDLTVLGNTVSIDVTSLRVENKEILLGITSDGSIITDAQAQEGGLILKGTTDHSILWNTSGASLTIDHDWDFSENIDIPAGRSYKIGGIKVIEDTGSGIQLTSSVTSAPGLSSFGAQISITSDNITINDNRIINNALNTNYIDGGSPNPNNIIIEPLGNLILLGSTKPKIIGVRTESENSINQSSENSTALSDGELSEATSKRYVTNIVRTRNIPLALDITGTDPMSSAPLTVSQIRNILNDIAPVEEYDFGTLVRISTFRYYQADIEPVTPTLSVTSSGGVVTAVAAQEVPRRAPAKQFVRRGLQIFKLEPASTPSGKVWEQLSTQEDAAPAETYPALFS
jgi:hypothetical protein